MNAPDLGAAMPPLCDPTHWRLERVAGSHQGYLLCLLCADEHLHFVFFTPLYEEARRMARAFECDLLGEGAAGWPLEDMTREGVSHA